MASNLVGKKSTSKNHEPTISGGQWRRNMRKVRNQTMFKTGNIANRLKCHPWNRLIFRYFIDISHTYGNLQVAENMCGNHGSDSAPRHLRNDGAEGSGCEKEADAQRQREPLVPRPMGFSLPRASTPKWCWLRIRTSDENLIRNWALILSK